MTLAEITEELQHVSDEWRAGTTGEQKTYLAVLDDLLAELDDLDPDTTGGPERIEELRCRIEILMDEIDISLGIEPPPITGLPDR